MQEEVDVEAEELLPTSSQSRWETERLGEPGLFDWIQEEFRGRETLWFRFARVTGV
jgi:hypothetical protein